MIAAIQAGGRSLRMGEDKAWLTLDGRPLIEHGLAAAQTVAERLLIIINRANPNWARYEQLATRWQAELLFDGHNYRGPLGGIETALQHCAPTDSALILACDLPFVTGEFLQLLWALHQTKNQALTVPLDRQERPQMLAAIYAARCLPGVSALLAANELKARRLLERVLTRQVRFAEYAHLAEAERLLRNINTREEHQQIQMP